MMSRELLSRFADIINGHSSSYRALVPDMRCDYMTFMHGRLEPVLCFVLEIRMHGKVRYHRRRTVWKIYEVDIARVIEKLSRRDASFAARIRLCDPTPTDVEIIIRRASLQSLKLHLSSTGFDVYLGSG